MLIYYIIYIIIYLLLYIYYIIIYITFIYIIFIYIYIIFIYFIFIYYSMSARMFRAKSKLKDFSKKVWKPLCPKGLRGVERETLKFTFCVYMHLWQKMAKWYIKFFICGWGNFKPQDVVFGEFGWMVWWNGEIDVWLVGNWGKIDKSLTENRASW